MIPIIIRLTIRLKQITISEKTRLRSQTQIPSEVNKSIIKVNKILNPRQHSILTYLTQI